MNIIRCLLLAVLACSLASCSSSRRAKSQARIYEGDTSPGIRIHEEESPGSPVGR